MGSRFRVFLPAARLPAAAGRMALAARVSMAIWRGRTRLPNRPPDLTARGVGGPGGLPTRPAVGEGAMWARSGSIRQSVCKTRSQTMTSQEAVLFNVSLSLSISPQETDAGATLTLKAVAECPEQYDVSGEPVLFLDATGHEVGSAPLA